MGFMKKITSAECPGRLQHFSQMKGEMFLSGYYK